MKLHKLCIGFVIVCLSYFLSGCGDPFCRNQHSGVFTIPNLYSVMNPKDTFHLNDTLWIQAQIPDTFAANIGRCTLTGDSFSIYSNNLALFYNNTVTDTVLSSKPLIFRIGNSSPGLWQLMNISNYYTMVVGVVLDNRNITGLGTDLSNGYIVIASNQNYYPCRYNANGCPAYSGGFSLYTTFQNGLATYPLIVR